jgi:hypothetical protein
MFQGDTKRASDPAGASTYSPCAACVTQACSRAQSNAALAGDIGPCAAVTNGHAHRLRGRTRLQYVQVRCHALFTECSVYDAIECRRTVKSRNPSGRLHLLRSTSQHLLACLHPDAERCLTDFAAAMMLADVRNAEHAPVHSFRMALRCMSGDMRAAHHPCFWRWDHGDRECKGFYDAPQ